MYSRLRSSSDGTIMATTTLAPSRAVEGEALITQSALTPADQAAGAELDEATVLQNLPVADALQTVRPTECPPCPPPQVVYRDRIVEKRINVPGPTVVKTVPGPTQYVYVPAGGSAAAPRYGTVPAPGAAYSAPIGYATYDEWWEALGRDAGVPYEPPSDQPGGGVSPFSPEQAGSVAGRSFPWWLLLVAGGAAWWVTRKKKR